LCILCLDLFCRLNECDSTVSVKIQPTYTSVNSMFKSCSVLRPLRERKLSGLIQTSAPAAVKIANANLGKEEEEENRQQEDGKW